jgi:threonine aldolase
MAQSAASTLTPKVAFGLFRKAMENCRTRAWFVVAMLLAQIGFRYPTVSLSTTLGEPLATIRLQGAHPELSPTVRFRELASICAEHAIDSWDVYGDFQKSPASDSFLRRFEAEVAKEFGKQDVVFMPSGVMAQSIALLIHYDDEFQTHRRVKRKAFACHPTSHLLLHEEEGFRNLCGFEAISVQSSTDDASRGLDAPPLLLEHIDAVKLTDVSTLVLELPHRELGGKLTPWSDIMQIQQFLHANNVAFHCDGARIFEATAGYKKSLAELAEPFDSVYISFYKGLGGLSGAMLMGTTEFCQKARVWLRRFGGNMYTLLPYAVLAWAGYQRHWKLQGMTDSDTDGLLSFSEKHEKLVRIVERLTDSHNGTNTNFTRVARFEPRIPEVCMVHLYLRPTVEKCTRIRDVIEIKSGICIFHRLRSLKEDDSGYQKGFRCMLEISVGEANGRIDDDLWLTAWSDFASCAVATNIGAEEDTTGLF